MTGEPVSLVDEAVFRPVRSGNSLEDTVGRLMQSIRLGIVAHGLFVKSLLSKPAGFDRFIAFPLILSHVLSHDTLPCC